MFKKNNNQKVTLLIVEDRTAKNRNIKKKNNQKVTAKTETLFRS